MWQEVPAGPLKANSSIRSPAKLGEEEGRRGRNRFATNGVHNPSSGTCPYVCMFPGVFAFSSSTSNRAGNDESELGDTIGRRGVGRRVPSWLNMMSGSNRAGAQSTR